MHPPADFPEKFDLFCTLVKPRSWRVGAGAAALSTVGKATGFAGFAMIDFAFDGLVFFLFRRFLIALRLGFVVRLMTELPCSLSAVALSGRMEAGLGNATNSPAGGATGAGRLLVETYGWDEV